MDNKTSTTYQAIKRMREHTELGIPFSIEFVAYNSTKDEYGGLRKVDKVLLRKGLRNDQSDKANTLIAYTDHSGTGAPRFFHLSLLMKFNEYTIKP